MSQHQVLKFSSSIACCAIASLFLSRDARATNVTWSGAVDTSWSTATGLTNWNPGLPAASGDSLFFDDSGTGTTNTDDIVGLSVAGLTFSGTTNSYVLNGSTPLALTGGATAVTNSSSQPQTISLPLSYGTATTITGGASSASQLMLGGAINNSAASGTLALSFAGVGATTDNLTTAGANITINVPGTADNWTIVDNGTSAAITIATTSIVTTSGTLNFGTTTSAPNFTISSTSSVGDHTIGADGAPASTLNVNNGLLLLKTRLNTKNGNVNVSGGQLQIWNQFQISNSNVAEISSVTVSGGLLDVRNSSGSATTGGTLFVASRGMGTLTITAGTIQTATLDVSRAAGPAVNGLASQGVVNLNGGTIVANTVTTASANTSGTGAGATAKFNFNGGTLKARANNATFIRDSTVAGTSIPLSLFVQAGGAIIDSNNFTVATAESLQHDPTLIGLDGGLTKKNTGTLTLSGISNFNGKTTIQGGTLALVSAATNNNLGASAGYLVGDTAANSAAVLDVTGITAAGGFDVQNGQFLAGFGTVKGAVSALVGSTVGPGNSIGTLTENTSLLLAGTLSIDVNDADPGVVDVLNDLGNLDISAATSAVTFNVTGTPSAAAYVFAKYASLTGTAFGTVNNLPAGYTLDYNYQGNNDIALVTAVPEPTSFMLAGIGVLGAIWFRRRKLFAILCEMIKGYNLFDVPACGVCQ